MILGILGTCDKRPFIYPLLKLLNETGDVLFITDNNQCKRLIEGSDFGTYQNITIVVTAASPDEIWSEINYLPSDFDHVVYDLKHYLADDVNEYVYLYTVEKTEDELDILDLIESAHEIKLVFGKPSKEDKKLKKYINVTLRDIYANEYCEVVAFPSYINKSMNQVIHSLVEDHLNISRKDFDNVMKKEVRL